MSTDRDPTPGLPPELIEIEAALGSLAPTRGRLDRDRLMYQAGRASNGTSPSGRRGWIAAAVLGLVAAGEGGLLARQPSERVVERLIVVHEPAASLAVSVPVARPSIPDPRPLEAAPVGRDRLAWQVLRYGLDGLPTPGPSAGGDRSATRKSLREEIDKVLELGDHS
jgi:hypothetical protein